MQPEQFLDCARRRRSPATLASFHQGHSPRNKGLRYPPDPPTVEEIIAVTRAAGEDPDGIRLHGLSGNCLTRRRYRPPARSNPAGRHPSTPSTRSSFLTPPAGFEPATIGLEVRRSVH